MSTDKKDFGGIIKAVYEPSLEALQVTMVGSGSPTVPNVVRLSDGIGYLSTTTGLGYRSLDVSIKNIPEILISHLDDSIRIGDGTNLATITQVGSKYALDVNIVNNSSISNYINKYAEITGVASGISTQIDSYTVPTGKKAFLQRVDLNGNNIAEYTISVNSSPVGKRTTYFTLLSSTVDFNSSIEALPGMQLLAGDIVKVEVLHNRSFVGNFNSRLQIIEE